MPRVYLKVYTMPRVLEALANAYGSIDLAQLPDGVVHLHGVQAGVACRMAKVPTLRRAVGFSGAYPSFDGFVIDRLDEPAYQEAAARMRQNVIDRLHKRRRALERQRDHQRLLDARAAQLKPRWRSLAQTTLDRHALDIVHPDVRTRISDWTDGSVFRENYHTYMETHTREQLRQLTGRSSTKHELALSAAEIMCDKHELSRREIRQCREWKSQYDRARAVAEAYPSPAFDLQTVHKWPSKTYHGTLPLVLAYHFHRHILTGAPLRHAHIADRLERQGLLGTAGNKECADICINTPWTWYRRDYLFRLVPTAVLTRVLDFLSTPDVTSAIHASRELGYAACSTKPSKPSKRPRDKCGR